MCRNGSELYERAILSTSKYFQRKRAKKATVPFYDMLVHTMQILKHYQLHKNVPTKCLKINNQEEDLLNVVYFPCYFIRINCHSGS